MIVYVDTSAWVKLYVLEARSEDVQRWLQGVDAVATSVVAYAEARATFARVLRSGQSSTAQHQRRINQLNRDWSGMLRVELQASIARNAGELTEAHALRGFDAIHLASALWLRDKADTEFAIAVFDKRLATEAARAGLTVLR